MIKLNHPYSVGMSQSQVIQNLLSERDTLKAKVELLDEALEWADLCRQLLFQCGDSAFPKTKRGIEKINTLLSKAKDLK